VRNNKTLATATFTGLFAVLVGIGLVSGNIGKISVSAEFYDTTQEATGCKKGSVVECATDVAQGKTTNNIPLTKYDQDNRWNPPSCDCSTFVGRVVNALGIGGVTTNYNTSAISDQYDSGNNPYIKPVIKAGYREITEDVAKRFRPGDILLFAGPNGTPKENAAHTGIVTREYNPSNDTYGMIHCTCSSPDGAQDVDYPRQCKKLWGIYRTIDNYVKYNSNITFTNGKSAEDYNEPVIRALYYLVISGYKPDVEGGSGDTVLLSQNDNNPEGNAHLQKRLYLSEFGTLQELDASFSVIDLKGPVSTLFIEDGKSTPSNRTYTNVLLEVR